MEVATTPAPLSITLDATLSGSTSNSYLTMATALQIAANMPGGGDWIAADEELRNLSLIQATRWLETLNYKGDRCKSSQRLKWPRNGAVCDGVTSDCSGIHLSDPGSRSCASCSVQQQARFVSWRRIWRICPYWHVRQTSEVGCSGNRVRRVLKSRVQQLRYLRKSSDHSGISMVDRPVGLLDIRYFYGF